MKTAMGMLMAVLGGLLIYDGFAGRSLWNDFLTVIRGQGIQKGNTAGVPTSTNNPNAAPNPQLAGGGDTANTQGPIANPIINPPGTVPSASPGPIARIVGGINGGGGGSF